MCLPVMHSEIGTSLHEDLVIYNLLDKEPLSFLSDILSGQKAQITHVHKPTLSSNIYLRSAVNKD